MIIAAAFVVTALVTTPVTASAAVGDGVVTRVHSADPPTPLDIPSQVPSTATPAVDDGDVRAIAEVGNTMVIGGTFTRVSNTARAYLATFNKSTGALSSVNFNVNGVVYALHPGPNNNTVYVGGNFTTINGVSRTDIALVDITTGQVVTSWAPPATNFGFVNAVVARGDRVYIGGTFTQIGGFNHGGLAALRASNGARDTFMRVQLTGNHNDSGSGAQGWIGPVAVDITKDGSELVAVGNFKFADGFLRDQVVQIDLSGAAATVRADWATDRLKDYCYSWAFDSWVRDVSYSPDDDFFVVSSTGGGVRDTLCDAAARFEREPSGTNVQPTWVSETGGDTAWANAITSNSVFVGGHQRWGNNPYGVDYADAGAVPRPGIMALDPISGRPLAWNPGRNPAGVAVYALLATANGLYMGSNNNWIGNREYNRPRIALFPYTGDKVHTTATAELDGRVYLGSTSGGTTNVLYRVNAGGSAVASSDAGPDWIDDSGPDNPYRNGGSNAAAWDSNRTVDATVPASTPAAIFDTERWSPSDNPRMSWAFPVASGTPLEVRLYFANRCTCTSDAGDRSFDVAIDGQPALMNFDIVQEVGDQRGTMRSFDITSDGTVNIDTTHVVENPLINGIEIVRTDVPSGGSTNSLASVFLKEDGTSAGGLRTDDPGGVDWGTTRGAFKVGNTLFYGMTDGFLHRRTFDGTTFGADQVINPYNDPKWKDVSNNLGGTYNGRVPSLYGQMSNVTGMTYDDGWLYYTLRNDSRLLARWFSPDSGIMDERIRVVDSNQSFADARGMFVSDGKLYYVRTSDDSLYAASFDGGAVTGSAARVSGPAVDGISWANRSLFLHDEDAPNATPVADFTFSCDDEGACAFDASGSTDPDGSIAGYAWDFGDNGASTGAAPSHQFLASGDYEVTLTVTDNRGATSTATETVQVTVPEPENAVVYVGAAHSASGAATFKAATVPAEVQAGDALLMWLTTPPTVNWSAPTGVTGWTEVKSFTNGSAKTTLWAKSAAADDAGKTVRVNDTTGYRIGTLSVAAYRDVDVAALVAEVVGSTSTTSHTSPTATAAAGDWVLSYWADRSVNGTQWTVPESQTVRDITMATGTGYQFSSVMADSGGPVQAGTVGGITATSSAISDRSVAWTIVLRADVPEAPNADPVASFTSSCDQNGSCSFDGSASSDSDGTIAGFAWDFGDNGTSTAAAPSHQYVASGDYEVTLTVTDNRGATSTATETVQVTVPEPENAVVYVGAAHSASGAAMFKAATVPSDVQAGDALLMWLTTPPTVNWSAATGVTGWTEVKSFTNGSAKTTLWAKSAAADDAGKTVRVNDTTGYRIGTLSVAAYRNVDLASLVAETAGSTATTSHTSPTATAAAGDWVLSYWADRSASGTQWTVPAPQVVRDVSMATGTGYQFSSVIADSGAPVQAGAVGGITATSSATSDRSVAWTVVLHPAG
ncbi:PKD domain-containing protein [Microbacterium sp. NPDC058345]|uniref:PKD domain-containing protein n=1 Tax=Microbacterium sp. NPDC058345 TaxID=3346455 RepID=UPI0036574D1B